MSPSGLLLSFERRPGGQGIYIHTPFQECMVLLIVYEEAHLLISLPPSIVLFFLYFIVEVFALQSTILSQHRTDNDATQLLLKQELPVLTLGNKVNELTFTFDVSCKICDTACIHPCSTIFQKVALSLLIFFYRASTWLLAIVISWYYMTWRGKFHSGITTCCTK